MGAIELLFSICLVVCVTIGQGRASEKLIGGVRTEIGDFPFIVSIRSSIRHRCGGSIIDEKHILTAAHCMVDHQGVIITEIEVRVGVVDLKNTSAAQYYEISGIVIHQNYDRDEHKNDIAILTLKESIKYSNFVRPGPLSFGYHIMVGWNATIIGWGAYNTDSSRISRYLRKLTMTVLSDALCEVLWPKLDHELQICALGEEEHLLSNGDSGGPLIYGDTIIGIASASGVNHCRNFPAIFTRVDYYFDWIMRIIDQY